MENLKNRDYYIVLDKSGSMEETDTPTGMTRWKYAQESVTAIAKKLQEFDPDGITVIPFAGTFKVHDNITGPLVSQLFTEHTPMGSTVLAPPMKYVFDNYAQKKANGQTKANGAILVVITDGQPSDEADVAKAIVQFTKKLDNGDGEFGIAMIQVGKDLGAKAFLTRLDDNLEKEGAKFDIVDTKTMDEVEQLGLLETLIASLND